jgi:pyruvate kinase
MSQPIRGGILGSGGIANSFVPWPTMDRRTKIVATIGPASRDPEVLVRMVKAGMDVARLNFSHGNAEEHAETATRVRTASDRAGRPVAILQDLPGPKLRIGPLRDGTVELTGDARNARSPASAGLLR